MNEPHSQLQTAVSSEFSPIKMVPVFIVILLALPILGAIKLLRSLAE